MQSLADYLYLLMKDFEESIGSSCEFPLQLRGLFALNMSADSNLCVQRSLSLVKLDRKQECGFGTPTTVIEK